MNFEKKTSLIYKDGASNKIYNVSLVKKNGGFVVEFEFGRVGSSLQCGTKTEVPVSIEKANKLFDQLVSSKQQKGYTANDVACQVGTSYVHVRRDATIGVPQILPQLLNPVDESDVNSYLMDDSYCLQEKMDGKRILLRKNGSIVEAINRKGLVVGFPKGIETIALKFNHDFVLDGELIGETIHLFDVLEWDGKDLRSESYRTRYAKLTKHVRRIVDSPFQVVEAMFGTTDKTKAFKAFKKAGVEGVVIKKIDSVYVAGRPASLGNQLKFKFTETCSCIVARLSDTKRSAELQLFDAHKNLIDVGKVTILPNFQLPKPGDIVEVRYLYAYPNGGSLFQPVYLGERDDIDAKACTTAQLKYKSGTEDDEG